MKRLSITRKATVFLLKHPKALKAYMKIAKVKPTIPKGYRKITKQ